MGSASIYVPILPICGLSQYKHQYFHPGGYLIRSVSTIHTREYSTFPLVYTYMNPRYVLENIINLLDNIKEQLTDDV